MPGAFHKLGANRALQALGLSPQPEDHTLRNVGIAAGAGAPFLGLIGRQQIKHDPFFNQNISRMSMEELERAARPGDILLTTDPAKGIIPKAQAGITGSEFYHAQPVVGRRGGVGTTLTAGELAEGFEGVSRRGILRELDPISESIKKYRDAVLLRPTEPLTAEQLAKLQDEIIARAKTPYAPKRGLTTMLRELFVPKIPGAENFGRVVCQGDVCSTLPAQSMQAIERNLLEGKPAKGLITSDYLRSKALEPVGAHLGGAPMMSAKALSRAKWLTRGGLGLGLAGTVYGLSEDPYLAAAPVGMVALPAAARKGLTELGGYRAKQKALRGKLTEEALEEAIEQGRRKGYSTLRPLRQITNLLGAKTPEQIAKLRGITRRTVPLALAGGLLSYLGAKGLGSALSD
jgi:hypothetical protein